MTRPREAFPSTIRSPASRLRMRSSPRVGGWTLLEILMVMSIIAILAGITFGVATGVRQRAAIGRAKVELATISTALEAYRNQYGDYPWILSTLPPGITSKEGILFNALAGKLGPTGAHMNARVFLSPSRMTLANDSLTDPDSTTTVGNAFVDPWGRPYLYFYKSAGSPASWSVPGFLLYSVGTDGASADPGSDGIIDFENQDNIDNVYAGRD